MPLFAPVHLDDVVRVDGQIFVGIYHHTEETRVRLQKETGKKKKSNGIFYYDSRQLILRIRLKEY